MKHRSPLENSPSAPEAEPRTDKLLRDAVRLVETGHPDRALATLNRSGSNTDAIRNARGVCLLRMGRLEDALRAFRALVLAPGSTWMKPDLPTVYYTNFCTVLLLTGRPTGCFDALAEITDATHPSVVRLRQSLERWQKQLSLGAWLMWKFGADPNVPVTLDFAPGEFAEPPMTPDFTPPQEDPTREAA